MGFDIFSLNEKSEYVNSFSEPHNIFDINISDNSKEHGKNCLREPSSKNQINNISIPCQQNKTIFLGKKREIFKVIYKKEFFVFSFGEYDKE